MGNIVAIVGRPNVGKSTLFNRFTQRRQAIVDSVSGVTRDRHYGTSDWNGRDFTVIDTGGYITGSEDVFEGEIRKQVKIAIEEASQIIFVVDVETGTTDLDMDVARILHRTDKPVFVVVNKVDNAMRMDAAMEFYNLGLGEYYPLSSINGSGTGELLDALVTSFEKEDEEDESDLPRFAIVGRPNAGKSSLVNALMGKNKNIVTDIAGTTRDSIDTHYNQFGNEFTLVDTAGLRKKAKVHENLEFYSVMRSIRAIEHSDVCIVMVDATIGFDAQDLNIFHLAEKNHKGILVLVNKWDLIENKETMTMEGYRKMIYAKTAPFSDYPIIFISATTKQRIFKAVEMAVEIYSRMNTKISTSELNNRFLPITESTPPPSYKGKYVRIKYITQIPTRVPTFAFFCNLPQYVKDPYKRFIENKMRDMYDLQGVPIRIYFRKK
ncbi:MAG: GTP-binding protein [Flavobacteriales bacterium]|mgnify:FL=1|jgi:GTP-binding protein|tara:strand:- start:888 stop:2195 length:1308 start_codon:yes stop_codon:yes gene_type:complete